MISYAQNAEDVVLARALRDTEIGFYVDVGAASPDEATVTRHFYEAGWSGINIEPLPEWAAQLRQVRSRDRTLEVACAEAEGALTLYRIREDPALSTLDAEIADSHRRTGLHVEEIRMDVRTLNSILEESAPAVIDFLKIDVEGAEYEVLKGLDLGRWRPRVVVVESTLPTTLVPNYMDFDAYLRVGRYVFASSDGINRYYAREEEADRLLPLLVPANATDDYIFLRENLLQEELARLRGYVAHLERELTRQPRADAESSSAPEVTTTARLRTASLLPGKVIELERVASSRRCLGMRST
jgi:FkbM family methyltransferase